MLPAIDPSRVALHSSALESDTTLRRLARAVEERPAKAEVALIAHPDAGVPKVGSAHLIGNILDHLGVLAVFDLVEQLPAELCVVALLVNGEGATPDDVDAILDVLDH